VSGPAQDVLQRLGMSGYEAKVYVALIAAGRPLNGYAVAKASGVPRSTVYETLAKLVARGAAFEVHAGDDTVGYLPLPSHSLVARLRRDLGASLDALEEQLKQVALPAEAHLMHGLRNPDAVLRRAWDVIDSARAELYVSAWPAELERFGPQMAEAETRGVTMTVLAFGDSHKPTGDTFLHRFSDPDTVLERVGCRLMVVVADRREVVVGGAIADEMWGWWSDDPVLVLLALEYVRHDIAMQVLVERMGEKKVAAFWHADPVLERLRTGNGAPGLDVYRPGRT
jgi:HTH-type transcriptional regulator, sugar sensing transcriptional regulator